MKRIVLTSSLIVLTILVSSVVAQEELLGPGITPDSRLYGLERAIERLRLILTWDRAAKARLHLKFAEERLAEAQTMIQKGKPEFVESLVKDYEKEINETEDEIEEARALGRNVTLLAEHVSNVTYKHTLVLERVLGKAPEPAKIHIEHAINVSIKGHETAVERILERINKTTEEVRKANCTTDADCRHLFCPQVLGHDTPICHKGKCKCGGKWEIVNKTEWRERFREEWTNETQRRIERIKKSYGKTKIEKRVSRALVSEPGLTP